MTEQFVSDEEYESYYASLNGLRRRIACDLPLAPGMRVLDLATGYGYFAVELARCKTGLAIVGIDISENGVLKANEIVEGKNLQKNIEIVKMDATNMEFLNGSFDAVANFTGLEDIHMTRGKVGVQRTFLEANRVLKPSRWFFPVVMPPDEMETESEKLEVSLFSYVCNATWLTTNEYQDLLEAAGFKLIEKRSYYTGKKLSPEQAKEEIRFACENVPRICGISTRSFNDAWVKFGKDIEENGLGHYSKVVLMKAQKCT